jgi:hypothetical protein
LNFNKISRHNNIVAVKYIPDGCGLLCCPAFQTAPLSIVTGMKLSLLLLLRNPSLMMMMT